MTVWDDAGKEAASAPAWWEAGLGTEDWKAQWIALPMTADVAATARPALDGATWIWFPEGDPAKDAPVANRVFRRTLEIPADRKVTSARFLAAADDSFTMWVNGKEAGTGAGWTNAFLIDLQPHLVPGPNALALQVNNGGGPGGLIGQVLVTFETGDPLTLSTDATWMAAKEGRAGWQTAAFQGSAWPAAAAFAKFGEGPWAKNQLNVETAFKPPPGPCPFLRKEFALTKPVRRARLYATALGLYEVSINGKKAGDQVFAPGWTDYKKRVQYQTYDVTALLKSGDNAVGAILADGWYAGNVGWGGVRNHYGSLPMFRARLDVEYADGTSETVVTDASWKGAKGPVRSADFLQGETYDARLEASGWDAPGFAAKDWSDAAVQPDSSIRVEAQRGPPVRVTEELKPKTLNEPKPGVWVFDLGQNMVGWARLKVKGKAGTEVTLRFAEILNPDKTLYTTNLRGAKATDHYVLKGGGVEVWEPRFTFHGFRFIEVTGYPGGKPPMDAVTGIVAHSDMAKTGTFACSNPMVNQLQSNIGWGLRGNFVSIPTDCPQRDERLGWMGDAQIFVRTACFNRDVPGFYTKWMVDVEDAQSPEGAFADVSPRIVDLSDGAPAWGDAGVIVPWTVALCYDDTRLIERHWAAMAKWIEYIRSANPDLVWRNRRNGDFGDWVSVNSDTPKEILATAFFAYSTRLLSKMAHQLGREEDAKKYEDLFQQIRSAFNAAFVKEDGRIYGSPEKDDKGNPRGNTQACYVLPLRFDLLPEAKRPLAAKYLDEDIAAHEGHLTTGFLGVGHLLPSLSENGKLGTAYALLQKDTYPSWGYSIKQGATTIWERWDGWTEHKGFQDPGMNSFNHYSFGSVGDWMVRVVAGIDLEAPAYKKILIRPRPGGGMTSAKASYDSIHGRIATDWKLEGGKLKLAVEIPANTTARVVLPVADAAKVTMDGKPVAQAEAVEGDVAVNVGSGKHVFAVDVK